MSTLHHHYSMCTIRHKYRSHHEFFRPSITVTLLVYPSCLVHILVTSSPADQESCMDKIETPTSLFIMRCSVTQIKDSTLILNLVE